MDSPRERTSPAPVSLRTVLLIALVAFAARFLFALLVFPEMAVRTGLNVGSDGYDAVALNLMAGHGYRIDPEWARTCLLVPVYPLFLVGVFTVLGKALWITQLIQALFGAVTTGFTVWLGDRVFGRRTAVAAGLAYALYPGDLVASARLVLEPITAVLVMLVVALTHRLWTRPSLRGALGLGVLLAVLGLTKSTFTAFPVLILLLLAIRPWFRARPRFAAGLAAALLVPVVVISAPWAYRCHALTGHWVYPSTLGGLTLMDGVHISRNLGSGKSARELLYESRAISAGVAREHGIDFDPDDKFSSTYRTARDEYEIDRLMLERVKAEIRAHPLRYAQSVLVGVGRFWYQGPTPKVSRAALALNLPIVLLALVGIVRALARRRWEVLIWLGVIAYMNLLHALTMPWVRYTLPVMPFMLIFAAAVLFSGRRAGPAAAG